MNVQLILVKGATGQEFEEIKQAIESGLQSDTQRIVVRVGRPEIDIDLVELPALEPNVVVVNNISTDYEELVRRAVTAAMR